MFLPAIGVMSAVAMSLMFLGAATDWLAARSARIDATRTIDGLIDPRPADPSRDANGETDPSVKDLFAIAA
jgi:hypothetical protein